MGDNNGNYKPHSHPIWEMVKINFLFGIKKRNIMTQMAHHVGTSKGKKGILLRYIVLII